ncbi:hypothetical protein [Penaeicola halotolerans]|uniref:hypothetical protein n=1 Tax=Penaeicola halotolerans TaxID=2793196 RepID=UPI001CF92738|nr:hypothetical protein [Penaeicola halotolerans]
MKKDKPYQLPSHQPKATLWEGIKQQQTLDAQVAAVADDLPVRVPSEDTWMMISKAIAAKERKLIWWPYAAAGILLIGLWIGLKTPASTSADYILTTVETPLNTNMPVVSEDKKEESEENIELTKRSNNQINKQIPQNQRTNISKATLPLASLATPSLPEKSMAEIPVVKERAITSTTTVMIAWQDQKPKKLLDMTLPPLTAEEIAVQEAFERYKREVTILVSVMPITARLENPTVYTPKDSRARVKLFNP